MLLPWLRPLLFAVLVCIPSGALDGTTDSNSQSTLKPEDDQLFLSSSPLLGLETVLLERHSRFQAATKLLDRSAPGKGTPTAGKLCGKGKRCIFPEGDCCSDGDTCCETKCLQIQQRTVCAFTPKTEAEAKAEREQAEKARDELLRQQARSEVLRHEEDVEKAKVLKEQFEAERQRQEAQAKWSEVQEQVFKARREQEKKMAQILQKDAQRALEEKKRHSCNRIHKLPSQSAGQFRYPVVKLPQGRGFAPNDSNTIAGDFNLDRRMDWANVVGQKFLFFIVKPQGGYFFPSYVAPRIFDHKEWLTLPSMDVSGDGLPDIVKVSQSEIVTFIPQHAKCFERDGRMPFTCFTMHSMKLSQVNAMKGQWRWTLAGPSSPSPIVTGDFNGDGKQDFARVGSWSLRLFISRGNGTYWLPVIENRAGVAFGWDQNVFAHRAFDMNGDCRTEIIAVSSRRVDIIQFAGNNRACYLHNGHSPQECATFLKHYFEPNHRNLLWNTRAFVVGDFNGDAYMDFAHLTAGRVAFFIGDSKGQFFELDFVADRKFLDAKLYDTTLTTLTPGDFDGDGKLDIVQVLAHGLRGFFPRGENDECWYKTGELDSDCLLVVHFSFPKGWSFVGPWSFHKHSAFVGDLNGDTKDDFWNPGPDYVHQFIAV